MHVTKYHSSRFPPVKQMSRYWSVHTIAQEGLVLNFLWLSRNSDAALTSGLCRISQRGLCSCGGLSFIRWLGYCKQDIRYQRFLWQTSQLHAERGYTAPLEKYCHLSNLFPELFTNTHRSLWSTIRMGGFCYFRRLLAFIQFSREIWPPQH